VKNITLAWPWLVCSPARFIPMLMCCSHIKLCDHLHFKIIMDVNLFVSFFLTLDVCFYCSFLIYFFFQISNCFVVIVSFYCFCQPQRAKLFFHVEPSSRPLTGLRCVCVSSFSTQRISNCCRNSRNRQTLNWFPQLDKSINLVVMSNGHCVFVFS
jgi:hypothetical protein